jgi:hypothetical protein
MRLLHCRDQRLVFSPSFRTFLNTSKHYLLFSPSSNTMGNVVMSYLLVPS